VDAPAGVTSSDSVALDNWPALIEAAGLKGPVGQLAQHAILIGIEGGLVRLALKPLHEHFSSAPLIAMMEQKLGVVIGRSVKVKFEKSAASQEAPAEVAQRERSARQLAAEESLANDPGVQGLLREFGGRLVGESIRPEANGKSAEK
jgi:DNA polymerase-3 subunit gamma/tau